MFAQTDEEFDGPIITGLTPTGWWADARCNDGAGSMAGLVFS
ncbi:hypothetical protein BH18ACT4_BH18ACT4_10910 [soil metagenome]